LSIQKTISFVICYCCRKFCGMSINEHGATWLHIPLLTKAHFTHEPKVVTTKLWEPKRECPKAVPRHLYNHVVWSWILKCSVKPYVTGPSTKFYFNEYLYHVGTHVDFTSILHPHTMLVPQAYTTLNMIFSVWYTKYDI
jgi:hypothetical protein